MVTGYRFQVTLAWPVRDRMDVLAKELGMTRSALITMLLNEKWKEAGHTDLEIQGKGDA